MLLQVPYRLLKSFSWSKQRYGVLITLILLISATFTHAATILVHGDSLSAGYGMTPEQSWVSLIAEDFAEHRIVNSSISGETTRGGLERLPDLLIEHSPDILVIELGGNDGLRGYPINTMRDNLQQMIDLAKQQDILVVLLGIQIPPNYGRRYTEPFFDSFRLLAEQNDLSYLPFLLDGIAENPDWMQPDGIHPTAEAQPMIVENVRELFAASLEALEMKALETN